MAVVQTYVVTPAIQSRAATWLGDFWRLRRWRMTLFSSYSRLWAGVVEVPAVCKSPLRNCEVGRLERAPDLLAVDLDDGVVKSIAVPAEALGDVLRTPKIFWHLTHAVEYRVA